jgi:anti-sigma regulatory factor (Ser/Thr protein kinase)
MARYTDTVELIRHELSTPVATALLYIGIAESYAMRLPVDVITPALRVVRSEVQRLKGLIETVTDLQRSGRPSLKPCFIDVGATVKAAAKRLLTTFAGTERVSISMPPHSVHGWWDPIAVEQIVTNLLTNALKFGQGRSVRLVVKSAAAGVTISVRDQGIGIAAGDRLRIFKRHEHAPAAQGGGMGLGLWLVRELAMAHGGRVIVQSRKGRGTTFTVLLRTQPPVLGAGDPVREPLLPRLPPQRSPMRNVSSRSTKRTLFPAYWQDRLAKSQVKVALAPRNEIDVAPTSTMTSPSLTANLKAKWPSRTRKSKSMDTSAARSSTPRRPLNRSRNFASPTVRGSGP